MKLKISLLISSALLISACITDPRGDIYDGGLSDLTNNGNIDLSTTDDEYVLIGDPKTCEEARRAKSYIGCDYWPTVQPNGVWSIFDYAVVVSNLGDSVAQIQVTGPNGVNKSVQIQPHSVEKIFLPWVTSLKQVDANECGSVNALEKSVIAEGGAYHLTSSVPVVVYQFNPLEYEGKGGPPGKSWSSCPGKTTTCKTYNLKLGCYSFDNDASLLIPSTAMTGNYRVANSGAADSYFSITATQNDTDVLVQLSSTGKTLAGNSLPAATPNQKFHVFLNAGDVAEIVAAPGSDLSGSVLNANLPIQVMAGTSILSNPSGSSGDHAEEVLFPAETWGDHYIVAVPTGPNNDPVGYTVRIYGNVDGTTLTYNPPLPGKPTSINAGEVIDIGILATKDTKPFNVSFEINGSRSFGVGTFMLSAAIVDDNADPPGGGVSQKKGDPSQTFSVPVEQYRDSYLFLAPDDYDKNYVDVTMPMDAKITLDGELRKDTPKAIGTSGFGVMRCVLHDDKGPAKAVHKLTADKPVGIQVMGYGVATSYQYPGGLNTKAIAPPPIIM